MMRASIAFRSLLRGLLVPVPVPAYRIEKGKVACHPGRTRVVRVGPQLLVQAGGQVVQSLFSCNHAENVCAPWQSRHATIAGGVV
jgi:hypothetical protein